MATNTTDLISEVTDIFDLVVSALDRFNIADNILKAKAKLHFAHMHQELDWMSETNDRTVTLKLSFIADLPNNIKAKEDDVSKFTSSFWSYIFKDIPSKNIKEIDSFSAKDESNPESPRGALSLDASIIFKSEKYSPFPLTVSRVGTVLNKKLDQYKLNLKTTKE